MPWGSTADTAHGEWHSPPSPQQPPKASQTQSSRQPWAINQSDTGMKTIFPLACVSETSKRFIRSYACWKSHWVTWSGEGLPYTNQVVTVGFRPPSLFTFQKLWVVFHWLICSFFHPLIHLFIHPFTHLLMYLYIHSFIRSFIHSSAHLFIHPSIHSLNYSSTHHSFSHLFIPSLIHPIKHSFTHFLCHAFFNSTNIYSLCFLLARHYPKHWSCKNE